MDLNEKKELELEMEKKYQTKEMENRNVFCLENEGLDVMNLNEKNQIEQENKKKNQAKDMENRNVFCLENIEIESEKNVDIAEEDLEDISAAQLSRKEKIINEFSIDMVHLHLHELNKH